MGDRVVDCARLESVCAERHPGFESPPIRSPRRTTARQLALRQASILMARIDSLIFAEVEHGSANRGNTVGFTTEKVSFQFVADSPCCGLTLSR